MIFQVFSLASKIMIYLTFLYSKEDSLSSQWKSIQRWCYLVRETCIKTCTVLGLLEQYFFAKDDIIIDSTFYFIYIHLPICMFIFPFESVFLYDRSRWQYDFPYIMEWGPWKSQRQFIFQILVLSNTVWRGFWSPFIFDPSPFGYL